MLNSLTKGQVGAILAVVGVIVVVAGIWIGSKVTSGTGCALTTAGLTAVIAGTRAHNSGAALIATTGVSAACVPLANALIERSNETVEFELTDASSGESTFAPPATSLLEQTPENPPVSDVPLEVRLERLGRCIDKYAGSNFLFRLCMDGTIT